MGKGGAVPLELRNLSNGGAGVSFEHWPRPSQGPQGGAGQTRGGEHPLLVNRDNLPERPGSPLEQADGVSSQGVMEVCLTRATRNSAVGMGPSFPQPSHPERSHWDRRLNQSDALHGLPFSKPLEYPIGC